MEEPHIMKGGVSNGIDVRRSLKRLLSSVVKDKLIAVDVQLSVGIDRHYHFTNVCVDLCVCVCVRVCV